MATQENWVRKTSICLRAQQKHFMVHQSKINSNLSFVLMLLLLFHFTPSPENNNVSIQSLYWAFYSICGDINSIDLCFPACIQTQMFHNNVTFPPSGSTLVMATRRCIFDFNGVISAKSRRLLASVIKLKLGFSAQQSCTLTLQVTVITY